MATPRQHPLLVHITLSSILISLSQNGYSKDFLTYGHDPGGLWVVLVLCHSVNIQRLWVQLYDTKMHHWVLKG